MKASKKRYKTSRPAPPPATRRRWEFPVIVAAILLIAAGGVMVWAQSSNEPGAPVEARGAAPRVAVAQDAVDHGDLKFETPVSSVFQVSNIGDQPLQILGEPQVELVEGC